MAKYMTLANIEKGDIQNLQEWAKMWGEIKQDIQRLDGEIIDAYAILGGHDFQFIYEADDEEAAVQIAIAIERYGLDTHTPQLVDIDRVGKLVEDI